MGSCFSSDSTPSERHAQQRNQIKSINNNNNNNNNNSNIIIDKNDNTNNENQQLNIERHEIDTLNNNKDTKELRILMLGLDNSGKTTVLYKLKLGTTENTVPTVGFNVETIKYKNILINAWDIGGQKRLRALWRHYYSGTDILVFVVDSADLNRLDKAKLELFKVLSDKELKNCEIIILANKQDLKNAINPKELIEKFDLNNLKTHQWKIIPTIATEGTGLPELLDWISNSCTN